MVGMQRRASAGARSTCRILESELALKVVGGGVEGDNNWCCSDTHSENSVMRKSSYFLRSINNRYVVAPGEEPWSRRAPRRDGPWRLDRYLHLQITERALDVYSTTFASRASRHLMHCIAANQIQEILDKLEIFVASWAPDMDFMSIHLLGAARLPKEDIRISSGHQITD
jgi:hypothetical protein